MPILPKGLRKSAPATVKSQSTRQPEQSPKEISAVADPALFVDHWDGDFVDFNSEPLHSAKEAPRQSLHQAAQSMGE